MYLQLNPTSQLSPAHEPGPVSSMVTSLIISLFRSGPLKLDNLNFFLPLPLIMHRKVKESKCTPKNRACQ